VVMRARTLYAEVLGQSGGCVGCRDAGGAVEGKHLSVAPAARRRGLGGRLARLVEERALDLGRTRVDLWTDPRFTDANRLYERLGYERGPETRELHDLSGTIEYFYSKRLG